MGQLGLLGHRWMNFPNLGVLRDEPYGNELQVIMNDLLLVV